ncbi:MAG: CoA transferase, partial [Ramlibacter sp.]
GGAHAGYRVYPCKDGRVAVAALEPHFAAGLCAAAGVAASDIKSMFALSTRHSIAAFFAGRTCRELDRLAVDQDLPLHTMAAAMEAPTPLTAAARRSR